MTIDHHIHFGHFYEKYYSPIEILQIIADTGVEKCLYSSTSSCIKGIKLKKVELEVSNAAKHFSPQIMQPLLWFIPDYIKQGVIIEKLFSNFPYKGIKLHPRSHMWNLNDNKHIDCLHSIFCFANENQLPVLIHTGEDKFEKPNFFEQFFSVYKKANIILAHCRPLNNTLEMFEKYNNIKGDIAFTSKDNIQLIINKGYKNKLLTATDFPITHYFNIKYGNYRRTLKEQYEKDVLSFNYLI